MPTFPRIPLPVGDRWMDVTEIAELFGVDPETVHRWARNKTLKSYSPSGKRRFFRLTDVNEYLKQKGLPTLG